jgi:hypothetical protein
MSQKAMSQKAMSQKAMSQKAMSQKAMSQKAMSQKDMSQTLGLERHILRAMSYPESHVLMTQTRLNDANTS